MYKYIPNSTGEIIVYENYDDVKAPFPGVNLTSERRNYTVAEFTFKEHEYKIVLEYITTPYAHHELVWYRDDSVWYTDRTELTYGGGCYAVYAQYTTTLRTLYIYTINSTLYNLDTLPRIGSGIYSHVHSISNVDSEDIATGRDWDEIPGTDGTTPGSISPAGGEFADTDPYDFNQPLNTLDFIGDPAWDMPYQTDTQGHFKTGMYTPYGLYQPQLDAFGECLWYNGTGGVLHELSSLFGGRVDPNAAGIISLINLPVTSAVAAQIAPSPGLPIYLCGNAVEDGNGSPALGNHLTGRFKRYTLGSITLKEVWGSAKDYTDTTIDIFLPFVGVRSLDPHHCINRILTVICTIDCFTGDILYVIYSANGVVPGTASLQDQYYYQSSPVYRFSGNCASTLPFSVGSNEALRNSVVGLGTSIIGTAVGAGLTLATAGAAAPIAASMQTATMMSAGSALVNGVGGILNAEKQGVQANGSSTIGGATGRMDYVKAFLIVTRPVPKYPNNWRETIGAPRYQELDVNSLHGYTLFSEIKLDDIDNITDTELQELQRELLSEGIIF